jgi:hypothetical protein
MSGSEQSRSSSALQAVSKILRLCASLSQMIVEIRDITRRRQDPNARRSLGDSRSRRQAQEASPGARFGLGEGPTRSLDARAKITEGRYFARCERMTRCRAPLLAPPRFGRSCCITRHRAPGSPRFASCGKLCRKSGGNLEQIQFLLGILPSRRRKNTSGESKTLRTP